MSLRRLANTLGKNKEKPKEASASSISSWSPSTSQSHTPLSSSVSLPENSLASNLQRYPSPAQSVQSTHSTGPTLTQNATIRSVAPFGSTVSSEAMESRSSLGSNETKDSETATLRLKRSLTRILGTKEEEPGHQYHYQKQSLSRKASKDEESASEGGRRSRKGSFFGSSSLFEQKESSSSNTTTPSSSSTKKIVSWIGQKQSGVTKKVQEVLRSGGPSSLQIGLPKAKARISSEFHDEDDDDNRSSTSSAASFVQMAPEDEVSRILSEPDVPSLPVQAMQAPFQIPANVFLPRSHTNLHALTLASLAFPPSPHPLLYIPNLPAFPRSSNPSSRLPRLPTFRAHLAKTRILDRLEAQDLTPAENESIMPFARQEDPPQPAPPPISLMADGESEEGRKINDSPGRSIGLGVWTRRPPALERFRVWQNDTTSYQNGDQDDVKYEPLSASTPYRTGIVISKGTKALAGLVLSDLPTHDQNLPSTIPNVPKSFGLNVPLLPLESLTSSFDTEIIDESMLMDAQEVPLDSTPTRATTSGRPISEVTSPRPLPNVPGNRTVDESTPTASTQQIHWTNQEEDQSPVIPVRPLPPRPLPMPPAAPQATVEFESTDGLVIVTTVVHTPKTSPRQSMHMSPPGSTDAPTPLSHSGIPSSSTMTSAPHTPMDPSEAISHHRMSMGSMSAVLSVTTGFSLEEMDGLEVTTPHELDSKRRSVASFKSSVHKRRSTASRTSHTSSPSFRNHSLPVVPAVPALPASLRSPEFSYLSSPPTQNGFAYGSMEALPRQNHSTTNSMSGDVDQITEDIPSLVAAVGPGVVAAIKPEDPVALEPSRTSHGHVDPFLIPQLSALNTPNGKLDFGLNDPLTSFSLSKREKSLSSDHPALSISVDTSAPALSKSERRSPLGTSDQASPTSSMQSPAGSESQYGTNYDATRSFASSTPVKFVRLKRSASSTDSSGTNGTGVSTGGGRLQRTIKDPSKFWPHNRRVDEKAEGIDDESMAEQGMERLSHASWLAERENMQAAAGTNQQIAGPTFDLSLGADDRPESGVSGSETIVPHRNSGVSAKLVAEVPSSPSDISSLPPDLALDVARLSDTSKLDLTLYTPQISPPSPEIDLPRRSISSALSESESASRSADVKEIAATMSPVPSNRKAGHVQTPSSERAARIDAHLESVSASRQRPRMGTQPRPDFLPYPGQSRDYGYARQPKDDSNRSYSDGSHDHPLEDEKEATEGQSEEGPLNLLPFGYGLSQSPPVSRPPARWSEASWKERQRTLNTLPLPSASISHSATRPLPYGNVINRTGSFASSSTPSIFRPSSSKSGTLHGRSLRM